MAQQMPSPEEIAAQLQMIRDQIAELQGVLAQLELRLRSVQAAKETVEKAAGQDGETLFPGDPELNTILKARLLEPGKAIVHLGLNVYAKLDTAKATEILAKKEDALKRSLETLKQELDKLSRTHDQYLQLLQALTAGQAAQQAGQQQKQGS
ncbi:prefoldin alpha subunit [Aeropyrum pernix K1]|uniref:Prefoldin subunit alpha n=1 Tax=Aeropyrum pernix (strain ATCC 700893 / DSM 11879 / JCM 9820 / NBRC 100138 / K1) TaxID=272557 RepID=PFDA_AERPE|nr:prefoldin subunit alpha [Aeropyrum pernix]Q9YD28.2 RecName: Full=Prefoldin subunit alpha; AltName: Full=GimC subunit alpha [Aeropyrum pernix K1]BAA80069.2 prefoldin alpha subunit [Aeropyrum pernix K1]